MSKYLYINPRPVLTIERTGGGDLGRCYSAMRYLVTSKIPLSMTGLRALRELGYLGYGQEFYCLQTFASDPTRNRTVPDAPGPQDPSGVDHVECSEVADSGRVVACPGINPYSGQPYAPHDEPYYTYACESRVDSSG